MRKHRALSFVGVNHEASDRLNDLISIDGPEGVDLCSAEKTEEPPRSWDRDFNMKGGRGLRGNREVVRSDRERNVRVGAVLPLSIEGFHTVDLFPPRKRVKGGNCRFAV